MIEKRRSPRVRALHLVVYGVLADQVEETTLEVGRTLDVSDDGVRVETKTRLDTGQELDLEIAVGDLLIKARGKVVHSRPAGPMCETGVEYTEIADEDRQHLIDRG